MAIQTELDHGRTQFDFSASEARKLFDAGVLSLDPGDAGDDEMTMSVVVEEHQDVADILRIFTNLHIVIESPGSEYTQ